MEKEQNTQNGLKNVTFFDCYKPKIKNEWKKNMRLLRKDTADSYLKGDFVYYWENGELKRSKYICAKEHSIMTEVGEFVYDEVGKTWFLTELVAKEKR